MFNEPFGRTLWDDVVVGAGARDHAEGLQLTLKTTTASLTSDA